MFPTTMEQFIYRGVALLLAISVHEFAHGLVATRLGDRTPRFYGRLTLNPFAHMDPIGALMLFVFRFGWAKPVPVNPRYFREPRKGMVLTGIAGPAANLLLAYVCAFLFALGFHLRVAPNSISLMLVVCIQYNLLLAAFNLIPVPPLDGSKILWGFLPPKYDWYFSRFEGYGYAILIVLVVTGFASNLILPVYSILKIPVDMIFSAI